MVVIYILAVILGLLMYLSKRRFGLACLGLVAGSIVSLNWGNYVTALLQTQGVRLLSPPLDVVVGISLILLPGLVLMIVGPKFHKKSARLLGGIITASLGLVLIVAELVRDVPGQVAADQTLIVINRLQPFIVVLVVVLALADIVHTHLPKKGKTRPHH